MKHKYLLTCLKKSIRQNGLSCPCCGHNRSSLVARKVLVTALRRCHKCRLLFRTPTTSPEENASFYQETYTQGVTTDCPSDEKLTELTKSGFKDSGKDFSRYIDVLTAADAKKGQRVFDFGCSWGYGSWQLQQHGFEVDAFEISKPRARFAREKLGVNATSDLSDAGTGYDVFFSAHVLEHVPSVRESISFAMKILKPGGLFVAFTPNGSSTFKHENYQGWNTMWGMVHPNFLDDQFYQKTLVSKQHLISSFPYPLEKISQWAKGSESEVLHTNKFELLAIARK